MFDWLLANSGLAAFIAFGLVLIPVVIIHEFGHFIAGKSVGITILEFGVGFPPRIGRLFMWRGTEFTINLLPLGGFVRPLGEDFVRQQGDEDINTDRLDAEKRGIENIKSVSEVGPFSRIIFLSAGAIANLITAFILFIVIGMMGIPGVRLHLIDLQPESPLSVLSLQPDDAIESIDGEFFVDANSFFTKLEEKSGETVEILVRRGDSGTPIAMMYDVPADYDYSSKNFVYVIGIAENSPADRVGLQAGDLIITFNDVPLTSVPELVEMTRQNLDQDVTLTVLRDGELETVTLQPRSNPPEGEGSMGIEINTAFSDLSTGVIYQPLFQQVIVPLAFGDAVGYSVGRFNDLFVSILSLPAEIIRGNITAAEARPVSIVGISQVGGVFLQQSIEEERPIMLLNYMAIISIALGLTNLLPLPALDGGRILFVVIEIIRGRPIPPERESVVHLLGLVFLLSLTVIIMINDIVNPITDLLP